MRFEHADGRGACKCDIVRSNVSLNVCVRECVQCVHEPSLERSTDCLESVRK